MIVFGHNNFKIKSFSTRDLGIPQNPGDQELEFQVRQKYAHLFWIPFFPIGKVYVVKKQGDSNMYEMPDAIKQIIQTRQPVKTPWYSFSLMILAAVVGLGFVGSEKLNDIRRENNYYEQQAEYKMMVKYPTTGDYYKFKATECSATNYSSSYVVLKVNAYDDDTLEFSNAYLDLMDSEQYSYSIDTEIAKKNKYDYNTFKVKKADMYKLFEREYRNGGEVPKIQDLDWCFSFNAMQRETLVSK